MWSKVKTEPGSCPCFYDLSLIFSNWIFIQSDNNLSLWSLSKGFHRNDGSLCFSTHISSVFIPFNEIMPITVTRMPYIDTETKCSWWALISVSGHLHPGSHLVGWEHLRQSRHCWEGKGEVGHLGRPESRPSIALWSISWRVLSISTAKARAVS